MNNGVDKVFIYHVLVVFAVFSAVSGLELVVSKHQHECKPLIVSFVLLCVVFSSFIRLLSGISSVSVFAQQEVIEMCQKVVAEKHDLKKKIGILCRYRSPNCLRNSGVLILPATLRDTPTRISFCTNRDTVAFLHQFHRIVQYHQVESPCLPGTVPLLHV